MFEGGSSVASDAPNGARVTMNGLKAALGSFDDKFAQFKIDGVGTALLMVRAEVHRAGIIFPKFPYKRRVESEGFGLWANDRGFSVVGLPNYEVTHKIHDGNFVVKFIVYWSYLILCAAFWVIGLRRLNLNTVCNE